MDIKALTKLVIERFKEGRGYSELDDDQLFKSIHRYLDGIYHKYFYIAQKKIEENKNRGNPTGDASYKNEYESVEDTVMSYANKVAAINKSDLI